MRARISICLLLTFLASAASAQGPSYASAHVPSAAQERRARDEALQSTFLLSQGAHFTILFEGPRDQALASRALDILERAYFRIGTALYTFPEQPITVVLYAQEHFRDATAAPSWAAGAYDGSIRVPISDVLSQPDELERVLSHELTHAIVQSIAPRGVPVWLNEGLAVNFEPHGREWADAELARHKGRIPLERLAHGFSGFSGDQARLAYAQSAVVARTVFDEGGAAAMVAILKDLAAGTTFQTAYEQRLFLPYATFAEPFEPRR